MTCKVVDISSKEHEKKLVIWSTHELELPQALVSENNSYIEFFFMRQVSL